MRCGYNLAGLPRHVCPECGKIIKLEEHIPPDDFPMVIVNGQHVIVSNEIRDLLADYSVPFLENKRPSETVMMGPQMDLPGYLCVPRDHYFEVIDLLRRKLLGQPMPPAPESTRDVDEWICPGCGESNPGHFDLCWNCQFVRILGAQ